MGGIVEAEASQPDGDAILMRCGVDIDATRLHSVSTGVRTVLV